MPHFLSSEWNPKCGLLLSDINKEVTVSNFSGPDVQSRTNTITTITVPQDGLIRIAIVTAGALVEDEYDLGSYEFATTPTTSGGAEMQLGFNISGTSISGKTFTARVFENVTSTAQGVAGLAGPLDYMGLASRTNEIAFHAKKGTTITLSLVVLNQGSVGSWSPPFKFNVHTKVCMD